MKFSFPFYKRQRVFLILLVALLPARFCYSQAITEYKPVKYTGDSVYLDEKKYKSTVVINGLSALPKKAQDEILDFYYYRQKSLLDDVHKHHFIEDEAFTVYMQFIFNEILTSNGLDKSKFKLRIARYPVPNATCDGSGNISFYIGLLKKMETEAQIAFILSHEIAHQLLNHVDSKVMEAVKFKYSKELKEELKEISKMEYGFGEKYLEYMKNVAYDSKKHHRDQESSADSLGLELLLKTRYNPWESLRVMDILDSCEVDTFTIDYARYFHSQSHPFNPAWIAKTKTLGFGNKDAFNLSEDSLKTHPDCDKRWDLLKATLKNRNIPIASDRDFIQSRDKLEEIRDACRFEELQYLLDFEMYGILVYYGLNLCREEPDDAMPYVTVAKSLNLLANAMKEHTMHEHVIKPSPDLSEYENQLLRLLDRVSIEDLKNINSTFLNMFKDKFYTSSENYRKVYKEC